MVDFGQAVAITFKEFFIDIYFSNCYSYVAVSNEMHNLILLNIFLFKGAAASDGLLQWELKCKQLQSLELDVF